VEKWERVGGYGQNALLLPPLSPDLEQRRPGWPSAGGGRRRPGGWRRPGKRGNGGGTEGISTPCSPWTEIACRSGSATSGGGRLWWLVVVVLGGLGGREARLGRCEARWGPHRPSYRRGEVGLGEGKIFPATFGGGAVAWPASGKIRCGPRPTPCGVMRRVVQAGQPWLWRGGAATQRCGGGDRSE
jgi:hypothetical protein